MFAQLTSGMDFHAKALVVRAERQRVIASNIANADTPGYSARDVDFKEVMAQATGTAGYRVAKPDAPGSYRSDAAHLPLKPVDGSGLSGTAGADLAYASQSQPAMDNNSVELDRERANFVDNSVRYEATLRFINGSAKTILSAIQGQ